jgi:hypothetical protein
MTGRLVRQADLTDAERGAMFALLNEYFDGVTRPQFDHDLHGKNWVIFVERVGTLLGFSTLAAYPTSVAGERLNVICSGDTIVAPAAWGSMAFPRTWIESVYRLCESLPDGRLIWLLLTSGFRTYRFLPVFWREFYPRTGTATPPTWQQMIDKLAEARFGAHYCQQSGIVRFSNSQRLREHLRAIPEGRDADEDIRFFRDRNPGHIYGDELVCATDLSPANLTAAGRRMVYGVSR